MLFSFGVSLFTLVAIVRTIVKCGQRFDYVEVVSRFQYVDFIFGTFVCCVNDGIKLFGINYVDFYFKVLSKCFYIGQIVAIVINPYVSIFM